MKSCLIEADKHKLSQVIRNFISNALKFTPAGGNITVRAFVVERVLASRSSFVSVFPEASVFRVEVQDTGHGIAVVCHLLILSVIILTRYYLEQPPQSIQ